MTDRSVCVTHCVVRWMWVVGKKVVCSRVSPSVMPCFWVVLTSFRCLVRHGSWLRGVCRVADGSVLWIWVFGGVCLRNIVGLCLVVSGCRFVHGVFGHGIWGVRVVFGGFVGPIPIFCVCCSILVCVWV